MSGSNWELAVDGAVAELVFVHPPHHWLDHAGVVALERTLLQLVDGGVRCVIVRSSESDVFVGHAELGDLDAMMQGRTTTGDPGAWLRALRLLDHGPFVTIAAINGRAWGGGLELALSCSLRVAGRSATFCFPEVAIGILPAVASHRLLSMLPEPTALELMLLAEPFDAARASELQLVNAVVDDEDVDDKARVWARRIVSFPATAVHTVHTLVLDGRDEDQERRRRRRQQQLFAERLADPLTRPLITAAMASYAHGATPADAMGVRTEETR